MRAKFINSQHVDPLQHELGEKAAIVYFIFEGHKVFHNVISERMGHKNINVAHHEIEELLKVTSFREAAENAGNCNASRLIER
mmetsp:Transcript_75258/g.87419  ORF Transcript_75258/g.87419 Transcript_75258/m.87419 type:complete len:83 (-) Transcript_75258:1281-1529(-)